MSQEPLGLRERKKQQTRQLIADTARRLFAERGFEGVRVAEVAREADVSEATVFNYFPTKEDLFYSGLGAFEEQLLATIRDRPPGESIVDAFGRFVLEPRGLLTAKDPEVVERFAATTRVIEESPALLAREQRIFAGYTDALAALIAQETGAAPDAIEPWVVANALLGLHRALVGFSRRQVLSGVRGPKLARSVREEGQRALAVLARGLADYPGSIASAP
jgi:AcrR family transcriptional regulator